MFCSEQGKWFVKAANGDVYEILLQILEADVEDCVWFIERLQNKPYAWIDLKGQFDHLRCDYDDDGNEVRTGYTNAVVEANLPFECVKALFTPEFIAQCQDQEGVKQAILVGAARTRRASASAVSRDLSSNLTRAESTGPEMRYKQGAKDTCVVSGMASAMHDYGFPHQAKELAECAPDSLEASDRLVFLHDRVRQKIAGMTAQLLKGSYDPITDESPDPVCIQVRGSDNGTGHAVTKMGTWLYDSSRDRALPFDTPANRRKALDLSVRAEDSDTHIIYTGVVKAVRVTPGAKLLKRKRMAEGDEPPAKRV